MTTEQIGKILDWKIKLGSAEFTVLHLIEFCVLLCFVFVVAAVIRKLLLSRVLSHTGMNAALQRVVARFAGYFVLFIGFVLSFQVVGINLGSLAFLAGAFSLGLGFGLQNVISNFVSGLIILIERPIQVGDRIDVGGLEGDVVEIKARSTNIVTNDNITIIIPNSEFISSRVINWSHGDPKVRFRVPVGVAYGSDLRQVEKLLIEVAGELTDVMKNPPPAVRLISFGESAIHFELRVWNETRVHKKGDLISEINFRIFEKFDRYGIAIPYPQRDVHIKTMAAPSTTPASTAQQSIAEYLRHTRLFSVLGDEDLMQLANSAIPRRFRRGQTIIEQGQEGDSMFVISRGVVAVKVRQPDGTMTRVGTLVRGEFFGEASMLTGEKRTATIVAESDIEAFEISKEALQPILSKNPNLAEQLSHSLAAHQEHDKAHLSAATAVPKPETHTSRAHGILSRIRSVFDL